MKIFYIINLMASEISKKQKWGTPRTVFSAYLSMIVSLFTAQLFFLFSSIEFVLSLRFLPFYSLLYFVFLCFLTYGSYGLLINSETADSFSKKHVFIKANYDFLIVFVAAMFILWAAIVMMKKGI